MKLSQRHEQFDTEFVEVKFSITEGLNLRVRDQKSLLRSIFRKNLSDHIRPALNIISVYEAITSSSDNHLERVNRRREELKF